MVSVMTFSPFHEITCFNSSGIGRHCPARSSWVGRTHWRHLPVNRNGKGTQQSSVSTLERNWQLRAAVKGGRLRFLECLEQPLSHTRSKSRFLRYREIRFLDCFPVCWHVYGVCFCVFTELLIKKVLRVDVSKLLGCSCTRSHFRGLR